MLINQKQITNGEYEPLKIGDLIVKGVLSGSVVLEHIKLNCYLVYDVRNSLPIFATHNPKNNYFKPYPPKTLWKLWVERI
jgi:hypothetical protein